jgi:alkylation response protein AidB-like acyl-CoA dehydrogenase
VNLALTDDQRMIREAAAGFLADASNSAAVRAAMESEAGFDPKVWKDIGELGWCGTTIAEEHGGLGLGPLELVLILEQMGRYLLCAPFFSSVALAATLLTQAGSAAARKKYLPALAEGSLRATAVLDAPGLGAGRGKLSGKLAAVADAASAQLLLFGVKGAVYAVPAGAKGLKVRPLLSWDATRRFADVELKNVAAERVDDPAKKSAVARAQALSRLYLAAEQLGGAQQCLDLVARYTGERRQFGRAIASFQAVKHRCAQMMVQVEGLRSLVYGAAVSQATPQASLECAAAKALAAETFFHCAGEAIQLHGGVGFTWEFEPQLHFKRAQAGSHWLGSANAMREQIAQPLLSGTVPFSSGKRGLSPFSVEVASWMRKRLGGRFAKLKHRGGPGDEEYEPALRKAWERELAKGGWTCVGWPKPWGRGLSIERQVIFHEEYARAGGPGRISLLGEGLLGPAVVRFGTEDQKQRHLPGIVAGTTYWAQGYSEPNAGSDLSNVQTRCEPQADGSWRVFGQKIWTSLAHESDWIFVLARAEPGSRGGKGLNFLLLPLKQPGITIRPIRQMTGAREFNEVFFDGARAAAEDVIGGIGNGWKVAMGLLEAERGVSTLGQQMRFAYELDLVIKAAKRNGTAKDPLIRQRIAQSWSGLRVMRYNALRMLGGGEATALSREALIFKYYWSNWHRELGKLAADVLGAEADVISDRPAIRPLQQLFFFSRADTIYAGTNEIQLNLIAERGLGMPKEPRGDK